MDFPVLNVISSVTFTMDLTTTVTSGYGGGVYLVSATNLVGLSVLPSIKVELLNNTTVVGSQTYSTLLNLDLLSTTGVSLCATPAAPYNKVRLTISSPLGVSAPMQFRVYYAYGNSIADCSAIILPVDLVKFEVEQQSDCGAKILWTAAHEPNSSYFVVQRQINNMDRWEDIGKVKAADFSEQVRNYSYVDGAVPNGKITYRLVGYDKDGSAKVYKMKTVVMNCDRKGNKLYPTIVQSGKSLILTEVSKTGNIIVSDIHGRVQYPANFLIGNELSISTAGMSSGVYFLSLRENNQVSHFKFIVQ